MNALCTLGAVPGWAANSTSSGGAREGASRKAFSTLARRFSQNLAVLIHNPMRKRSTFARRGARSGVARRRHYAAAGGGSTRARLWATEGSEAGP